MRALLTTLLILTLAACGGDSNGGSDGAGGGGGGKRTSSKPPMDEAAYKKLQQTQIAGWTGAPSFLSEHRAVVHYVRAEKTPHGGTMKAMVALEPAMMAGSMDPDVYKGKEDQFIRGIDKKHGEDPDLVWSYGALDLGGGKQGIHQYVRSYVTTMHDGRPMGSKLNSYIARYHDGTNGITISLFVHGLDVKTADEGAEALSKEIGDDVARTIFAAFAASFD